MMSRGYGFGMLLVGLCGVSFYLLCEPPRAAEPLKQKPVSVSKSSELEKAATPLTATDRASKILGLLKHADGKEIDGDVLAATLDDFAILAKLPQSANDEQKARAFIRTMCAFLYENQKRVALARAEAGYNDKSAWITEITDKE